MVVGRLLSYWEGHFSRAMLNFWGCIPLFTLPKTKLTSKKAFHLRGLHPILHEINPGRPWNLGILISFLICVRAWTSHCFPVVREGYQILCKAITIAHHWKSHHTSTDQIVLLELLRLKRHTVVFVLSIDRYKEYGARPNYWLVSKLVCFTYWWDASNLLLNAWPFQEKNEANCMDALGMLDSGSFIDLYQWSRSSERLAAQREWGLEWKLKKTASTLIGSFLGTNISHPKALLNLILLLPSWDMWVPSRLSKTHKTCMYASRHVMPCVKSVFNPEIHVQLFHYMLYLPTNKRAERWGCSSHQPDKIRRPFPMETKGGGGTVASFIFYFGIMIGRIELVKL